MADDDRQEFAALRDRIMDAVSEAVSGTNWGPPGEDPAVLSEVVVCMGWTLAQPGLYATSYLRSGSTWSSKGLLRDVLNELEETDTVYRERMRRDGDEEDD